LDTTKKIPYIIDFIPYFGDGSVNGREAAKIMLDRLENKSGIHVIMDAGYFSSDIIDWLMQEQYVFTISSPSTWNRSIWIVNSLNLLPKTSRISFSSSKSLITSVHCEVDHNGHVHHQLLVSNAFKVDKTPPETQPSAFILEAFTEIAGIVDSLEGAVLDISSLSKMRIPQLKSICKKLKIKAKGNKKDMIEKIIKISNSPISEKSKQIALRSTLETQYITDPAIIHDLYKSNFNVVDLIDRFWYKIHHSHTNKHWRGQLLNGMLRNVFINSYSFYYSKFGGYNFVDFCLLLSKELIFHD
jgi:hypothetical protein